MKKKYILDKIQEQVARGILNPNLGGDPVGLKITKQALKKSKEVNDSYYKELDKKFKDYLKLDVKDNPSPKVNMTDSDHEMYYGTGMEGLKYDDEGTEKHKKFVERNKELNKPSKDYYLNKDGVEDSYGKIMKDGENYKKHKYEKPDEYQKTPKVRITKESTSKKTMKQLNFKKPFLSEEKTMNLIPESFKFDRNKFAMTDGVESYTIRWEGDEKGTPVVLKYKNEKLVKEDVQKIQHLYGYKSEDTLMKTNDALTENQIFRELLGKSRTLVNEQDAPAPTTAPATGTKPTGTPTTPKEEKKVYTLNFNGKIGDENKDVNFRISYVTNGKIFEISKTELIFDGKTIENPNTNNVTELIKNVDLVPSSKSTLKFDSVYNLFKRIAGNKNVLKLADNKKLLANAKSASALFPHKYNESFTSKLKPTQIEDATIKFYPYKTIDQITNTVEGCKLPSYFSVNYKGTESELLPFKIESLKTIGDQFRDSNFSAYALGSKKQELFDKLKGFAVQSCKV